VYSNSSKIVAAAAYETPSPSGRQWDGKGAVVDGKADEMRE